MSQDIEKFLELSTERNLLYNIIDSPSSLMHH